MSIDVEPRDLGKVVQLVAKSDGWKAEDIWYSIDHSILITGNPDPRIAHQTPPELIQPLRAAWLTTQERRPNDFNGPKVAVRRLAVRDGILEIDAVGTDYFTLWGLPQADVSKPLFAEHERQVVIKNKARDYASYETDLPWGICSHNVLLDPNGDVFLMVRSMDQGFNAGRISATQEEQMEPEDGSPFSTSQRSFSEELHLWVPERRISLAGVAMEKGAAYPAFGFIAETDVLPKNMLKRWRKARDYNENTALFAVPMTQIDRWMSADEITSDIWQADFLAGNIAPDARLKLHNTSAWRLDLARRYIQSS
ncbi:MAG: hypothetical protein Q7R43_02300 [Candidatus Daviesbacteria bacterium]|nr:hypothetical protein [Candidatus Daviesbacteria bacterium]